jgi:hypothetical protein
MREIAFNVCVHIKKLRGGTTHNRQPHRLFYQSPFGLTPC